jgi:hypothetical protein
MTAKAPNLPAGQGRGPFAKSPSAEGRKASHAPASEGVGRQIRPPDPAAAERGEAVRTAWLGADIPCGFGHHVRDASKTLCGGIREVGAQDVAASREEDALPLLHLA